MITLTLLTSSLALTDTCLVENFHFIYQPKSTIEDLVYGVLDFDLAKAIYESEASNLDLISPASISFTIV